MCIFTGVGCQEPPSQPKGQRSAAAGWASRTSSQRNDVSCMVLAAPLICKPVQMQLATQLGG